MTDTNPNIVTIKSSVYPFIELKYDGSIEPGNVVTGYHKGYHKVLKVTPRNDSAPLIQYANIKNGKVKECDASYCTKVDPETVYRSMIDEAEAVRAQLKRAIEND